MRHITRYAPLISDAPRDADPARFLLHDRSAQLIGDVQADRVAQHDAFCCSVMWVHHGRKSAFRIADQLRCTSADLHFRSSAHHRECAADHPIKWRITPAPLICARITDQLSCSVHHWHILQKSIRVLLTHPDARRARRFVKLASSAPWSRSRLK
jgi:hypothetical protein